MNSYIQKIQMKIMETVSWNVQNFGMTHSKNYLLMNTLICAETFMMKTHVKQVINALCIKVLFIIQSLKQKEKLMHKNY